MSSAERSVDHFGNLSWDARHFGAWLTRLVVSRRWILTPTATFVVSRLAIILVAYLALVLSGGASGEGAYHLRGLDNLFVDAFGSRWDTGFYVSIVEEGYVYEADPFPSVAFFPFLPLLMKGLLPLVGDAVIAGLIVVNGALWIASIIFYQLVADQWGEETAGRAVWYLLLFPTAFFGSAIYSEAVFLMVAIGALLAGRKRKWWLAGMLGIAATATRLVGVIILPLLLIEWFGQRLALSDEERPGWITIVFPLITPAGLVGYVLYLWQRFDDPLGFVTASTAWGRVARAPFDTITGLFTEPAVGWLAALQAGTLPINDWIDLFFVLLFFLLGIVLMSERRWSEGIFIWLGVMIAFSSGLLMSQRRYVWILFPAFILLARWGENAWVDRLITIFFVLGLGLFTALFANGYWVG